MGYCCIMAQHEAVPSKAPHSAPVMFKDYRHATEGLAFTEKEISKVQNCPADSFQFEKSKKNHLNHCLAQPLLGIWEFTPKEGHTHPDSFASGA